MNGPATITTARTRSRSVSVPGSERALPLTVEAVERPDDAEAAWQALSRYACDPFSGISWCKAWYEAVCTGSRRRPVIVIGRTYAGDAAFLVPLVLERIGPLSMLTRPGKTHSAYSCGLFSPQARQLLASDDGSALRRLIASAVPEADALVLDGVPDFEIAGDNPLARLPRTRSGTPSHAMAVNHDWQAQYEARFSAKTRSNDRRQERRLGELGAVTFRIAGNAAERRELLDQLIAHKSAQLSERGLVDPFQADAVRAFYHDLVARPDEADGARVFMAAVELDGAPIAINLGVMHSDEFHGLVMAMAPGPWLRFAPGRILLRRTMQHLSQAGIRRLDFGLGEASYKDEWCDELVERWHVLAPFRARGKILTTGLRVLGRIKETARRWPATRAFLLRNRHLVGMS